MTFELVKRNFDQGLWTVQMVRLAVKKGVISKGQFKEITGSDY